MTYDEMRETVKEAVAEGMAEALKGANLVDGPTHLKHHELINDVCKAMDTAKTTFLRVLVTALTLGLIGAVVLFWRGGK